MIWFPAYCSHVYKGVTNSVETPELASIQGSNDPNEFIQLAQSLLNSCIGSLQGWPIPARTQGKKGWSDFIREIHSSSQF